MRAALVALVLCGFPAASWAADYERYVKDDGSDQNTGTSWADAWRTLTEVRTSVTLDAGDTLTVYLRHSDTIQGYYDSDNVADDALSITIKGVYDDLTDATGADRPILLGGEGSSPAGGSTVYGSHIVIGGTVNVTVKNLQLVGQDHFPTSGNVAMISMRRVNDALLDNCLLDGREGTTIDSPTHHYNAGISFRGTTGHIEVMNSTVQYFGPPSLWGTPELPSGDDGDHGYINTESICLFYGHTDRGSFSIHDNVIRNCNADGIQIENTVGAATASIQYNAISNCGENTIDVKYSQNHLITNNHVYRDPTFLGAGGIPYQSDTRNHPLLQLLVSSGDYHDTADNAVRENLLGPSDTPCLGLRSGSGVTHTVHDNDIESNKLVGCSVAFLSRYAAHSNRITNNFAVDIVDTAILSSSGANNVWENNTFVSARGSSGALLDLGRSAETFRNNIFLTNDATNPICDHGWDTPTFENNIWHNAHPDSNVVIESDTLGTYDEEQSADWNAAGGMDDIFADPQLDPLTGIPIDATSFCIDRGATPSFAFEGLRYDSRWGQASWNIEMISRTDNAPPDVGAYEYSPDVPPVDGGAPDGGTPGLDAAGGDDVVSDSPSDAPPEATESEASGGETDDEGGCGCSSLGSRSPSTPTLILTGLRRLDR